MPHAIALFLVAQDLPSAKALDSTFQSIIYFGVVLAVVILSIGFGLQWIIKGLQKFGFLKTRQEFQTEPLKRVGDLTVESFESKMRHTVRGEMQILVMSFKELKDSNSEKLDSINENLIRLVTLEEMRSKS